MILAHGFGAVGEARLEAVAGRFCDAGYAALVFDYRHFGASTGRPRQLLDVERQVADWRAALGYARGLDGVDRDRMVLWGTSFSGGHVVQVASADRFLAAAVAQVPFVDGLASMRLMTPSHALRLSAAAIADLAADRLGRSPRYLPIVGPPGSTAMITAAGAEAGYRALFPAGYPFRNEVAARVVLQVGRYRPVTVAAQVSCPLLMCVCDRDAVCPVEPAVRAAALARAGELCRYDAEHFDIYFGELFERAMQDQIEFLRRHVPVAGAPAATAPRSAEEKAGEPLGEERAGIVGA